MLTHAERVALYEQKVRLGYATVNRWKLWKWVGRDDANAVARLAVWEAALMCDPARVDTFGALVVRHTTFRIRRAIRAALRQDATLRRGFADVGDYGDDYDPADHRRTADPDAAGYARELLAAVPQPDRRVLEMRFGLGGRGGMVLEEIGAELGVTHQRVMQIEGRGLRRLRKLAGVA